MLAAALSVAGASAADFVLAQPEIEPSWGGVNGQPIAPSVPREADRELASDLTGQTRAGAYTRAMLASAITLDQAAAYRFYAPAGSFILPPDRVPLPRETGSDAAADAASIAAKAIAAERPLAAELDARFAALTAALNRSAAIVLPQGLQGAVTYCRWIGQATRQPPIPQLATDLWRHCIAARDVFIGALVSRLADLAAIPDLPPPDGAAKSSEDPLPDDFRLPRSVLPGEQLAPLPFEPLAASFQARLQARFEEARPRLEAQLGQALARRGTSDVILPAADDCHVLLGPYAGPLVRLPPAAGIAGMLGRTCMAAVARQVPVTLARIRRVVVAGFEAEAARVRGGTIVEAGITRTPAAACTGTLAPHFPAPVSHYDPGAFPFAGLDQDQSADLRRACLAAATDVVDEALAKHLAAAVADSHPASDTLAAWEAQAWFPAAPGGTGWISGQDQYALSTYPATFQAAYEAEMGPIRKVAATRWVGEIQLAFAAETGVEPEAASRLCAVHYGQTVDDLLGIVSGTLPDWEQSRHRIEAIAAKPSLGAGEAAAWVEAACRGGHSRVIGRRVELAVAAAGVVGMFAPGQHLAVRSPAGELRTIDPDKLVRAAAVDGLQVTFARTNRFVGIGGTRNMRVTPFGQAAPALAGTLVDSMRGDDKVELEAKGLPGLPGLDGPLATVQCLAMPVEEAYRAGQARRATAVALALFDDLAVGGLLADRARQDMVDAQACDGAKKQFRRLAVTR